MINLFNQLKQGISEKIALIIRNMSPCLADRLVLVEIVDMPHSAFLSKMIEDVKNRAESFRQVQSDQHLPRCLMNEVDFNTNSAKCSNYTEFGLWTSI